MVEEGRDELATHPVCSDISLEDVLWVQGWDRMCQVTTGKTDILEARTWTQRPLLNEAIGLGTHLSCPTRASGTSTWSRASPSGTVTSPSCSAYLWGVFGELVSLVNLPPLPNVLTGSYAVLSSRAAPRPLLGHLLCECQRLSLPSLEGILGCVTQRCTPTHLSHSRVYNARREL